MKARFAIITTLAFLALSTLSPLASAWGSWTGETHRYFIPGANNWSSGYAVYAHGSEATIYDGGFATYSFTQAHANGLNPDVIRFRLSDRHNGGYYWGDCWYQVIAYPAGIIYDTGWTGCTQGIDFHYAPTANNVQYDIRVSYRDSWSVAIITYVEVLAIWESMGTYLSPGQYTSGKLTDNPTGSPGTCIDVGMWKSRMHTTILEIDWGDGLTSVHPPAPQGNGYMRSFCHSYPPSAAPYQMCLRARETNGLQRSSVPECMNLYWTLPRIL